jgi:methylphosphotriester-DNA--protein-cysteine methyltransferase
MFDGPPEWKCRKANRELSPLKARLEEQQGIMDRLWAAVVERDPCFDGKFVYAVRTTGIYCRPTCPSRRGNQHNVAFYDTCRDAERAGFRACKRCRPA